jgi:tRNA A37 threonylcarbamoyladenosine dehydratase
MKKVLFVLVLMMSVIAVNAQTAKTTATSSKSTKTTIKVADLPKTITDNIAKDYAGYTIKEAESVTAHNVVTTHVVITKGTSTETLVYDKDGMFVKKLPAKTAPKHKTSKKK